VEKADVSPPSADYCVRASLSMDSSIPEHGQVMDAIFRGDSAAASQVMRAHVTLLGEGLSDLLHFLRMSGDENIIAELT
jgi:DNA-binding FadR family transcriptional regulator